MSLENNLLEIQISEWQELSHYADTLDGYVFRGQGQCQWGLLPSLVRIVNARNVPHTPGMISKCESEMIELFKRQVHQYLPENHMPQDDLDCLAMMQHHGAPTRLLDCTRSFYVACFFAIEDRAADSAIWAINEARLLWQLNKDDVPVRLNTPGNARKIATKCIEEQAADAGILVVEPYRLNQRMISQQAVVVCPKTLAQSFDDCLTASYDGPVSTCRPGTVEQRCLELARTKLERPGVIKLILPKKIHLPISRQLRQMNITASTLFPGIDGFARGLFDSVGFLKWCSTQYP